MREMGGTLSQDGSRWDYKILELGAITSPPSLPNLFQGGSDMTAGQLLGGRPAHVLPSAPTDGTRVSASRR